MEQQRPQGVGNYIALVVGPIYATASVSMHLHVKEPYMLCGKEVCGACSLLQPAQAYCKLNKRIGLHIASMGASMTTTVITGPRKTASRAFFW